MKSKASMHVISLLILLTFLPACTPSDVPSDIPSITPSTNPADSNTFPVYEKKPYIRESGVAVPGEETEIDLEDGAAIIVPVNSISEETTITIERNPKKINDLEPYTTEIIPLGDFYNFETNKGLIGPVDLEIPFNPSLIPDEPGFLIAAFPTESGWEYIPVTPTGDTVTLYTIDIGDPLIAWHFTQTEAQKEARKIKAGIDPEEPLYVCDKYIRLTVTPKSGTIGTEFTLSGYVLPVREIPDWAVVLGAELSDLPAPAHIPVEIKIGTSYSDLDTILTVTETTNSDGSFTTTYIPSDTNWFYAKAKAQCDEWFGILPVISKGRASAFRVYEDESDVIEEQATDLTDIQIPDGAIDLPDFIGMKIEDAVDWLKSNGFGYTWIDGESTYDLGIVYKQEPSGDQYFVPHRTTVVLYRTTLTSTPVPIIEDPYIVIEENSNCREGPSQLYPEVAILYPGEKHIILRQNQDGDWFFINPPGPTKKCWVWGGLGKSHGNPAKSVSVMVPPPPPKPDGSIGDLSVSQRNISLSIRDSASIDGDRIKVKLNGKAVLKDYKITANWKSIPLNLLPGDNIVIVKALNEGSQSPNTVEVKVSHVAYGKAIQVSGGLVTGQEETFSIFAP